MELDYISMVMVTTILFMMLKLEELGVGVWVTANTKVKKIANDIKRLKYNDDNIF